MVVKLADLLDLGVAGHRIRTMFLDSAGISGAIGSRLWELGHRNVIEINFGADSPDPKYLNMRSYMWVAGSPGNAQIRTGEAERTGGATMIGKTSYRNWTIPEFPNRDSGSCKKSVFAKQGRAARDTWRSA